MLYTVKQVRIEPATCNNDTNKQKRLIFAQKIVEHQEVGDFIVYFDETNFNIYCSRTYGRSKRGQRACVVLPPSKGPNLQIQCAVSSECGHVCFALQHGSIRMQENATFVESIYNAVKGNPTWQNEFQGKKIVIVMDNTPAHSQTEQRVASHDDMVLLRLGPYSPMLNPIECCFSVLKARIKTYLAVRTNLFYERRDFNSFLESRVNLLEEAARECLPCITQSLVVREAMFCQRNVDKALRLEDMVYGMQEFNLNGNVPHWFGNEL
ncbi:hypothetical protein AeMF1_016055, partial [Aphanomyces euteiches]